MSLKSRTISGLKWSSVSTVTIAVLGLAKIAILTRFLDKSDFGLIALIMVVLGVLNLFTDLGISIAILHKQEISKEEYASLYWLNNILCFSLFLLSFLISPPIATFYNQPELSSLIPLMSVNILFTGIGGQFKLIKQKQLDFKYLAIVDIIGATIGLIISVILAVGGYGIYSLIYSILIQYAISNSIYLISGLQKFGMLFHFNFRETKSFLHIGLYYTGGQIINYFSRDLDIIIVGKFFGPDILGAYSLAKQLVQKPARMLNPIITKVASPVLALVQKNIKQLETQYFSFLNLISTANFTVYLLMAIFAFPIVSLIYGADYHNIVIIVQVLSIYAFLRSIGNPIGSLIIATGKTHYDFYWNLCVTIIYLVAIYFGTIYGIVGVAVSMAVTILLLFVPGWYFLINKIVGSPLKAYIRILIPNYPRMIKIIRQNL